mmetsp:Transcript_10271/g.11796  ORF Transcript_10271/g.11796 Transcript_10271/m.11796 type:complete len:598 (+) Transcript_10271:147-1940(+)
MPKKNKYQIDSHDQDELTGQSQTRPDNKRVVIIPVEDFDRQYDLTLLGVDGSKKKDKARAKQAIYTSSVTEQSYPIDPWEAASPLAKDHANSNELEKKTELNSFNCRNENRCGEYYTDECLSNEDDIDEKEDKEIHENSFIMPSDIHPTMEENPTMEEKEDEIAHLRLLAGKLNADWMGADFMAPALARRIRDFQFAQEKRRRKYGHERPWGILGLYEHLASIRVDVEWAEDGAWRRANGQPYLSWADFDASKKKGVNRPFFTYFILFTCTITLIVSIALNGWQVEQLDVNPMIGPSADTLILMGAKDSSLIVAENEVWRLLSSAILHAGLVHYVVNCIALWFIGTAIETTHGTVATAILFIIPAIGGTILSAIFLPEYITVGASGGIFGLIGACISDIIMNWKHLFSDFVGENGRRNNHLIVVVFLIVDIALNCLIGLTPYVDNFTHLGGLIYGLLCGLSTMERLPDAFFGVEENCYVRVKQIMTRFLGLFISIILIIITIILLFEFDGENAPCPKCMWLSCVPFPPWKSQGDKWWYCDDCGRVSAEIMESPSLHLQLECPGGTSIAVGLETDQVDRKKIEDDLPGYCRNFCYDES